MQDLELLKLIKNYHDSLEKNDKSLEIKSLISLGQYYYKYDNFEKSKFNFKEVLKKNSKIEGINYYLSLIEIQNEEYNLARKYLKEELKLNSKNEDAKILLEKLEVNSNFPVITLSLILLNILVFLYTYPSLGFVELIKFTLNNSNLNLLSAITSIFFHFNLLHILFNMIFLLMFGLILEKSIGSFKFLIIYLSAGILGNLFQAILTPDGFVLGASGAIFGIIGALLLREPLLKIRVFGLIKVSMILLFGAFFSISVILQNFLLSNTGTLSGDISHIFGFLIGIFLTGIFYREKIFVFYNWIFIAFGFFLLGFSFKLLFNNFNIVDFELILKVLFLILVALFLIIYSYLKLKLQILVEIKK